ncbi:MAG: carboxylating nicotinate-nucleotide diphosphorylase [Candidatus Thorarchaeota archaeon]
MPSSSHYVSAGLPRQVILQKFYAMLEEDIGFGDVTTSALIAANQLGSARLFTREPGTVAGLEIASIILEDFQCQVKSLQMDGSRVKANTTLLEAQGRADILLSVERTLLNLLQRMSGIATTTANLLQLAQKTNPQIRVAATRKTAPLLRYFDKYAVIMGGGDPHRWRLDDAILIKDNHLSFYSDIHKAIQYAKQRSSFTRSIEIEVTTPKMALEAAKAGVDALLLDNLSPKEVSATIKKIQQMNLQSPPIIEVSGNITPDNITQYAQTGVDVISIGWITHSVPSLNLSIDITPLE